MKLTAKVVTVEKGLKVLILTGWIPVQFPQSFCKGPFSSNVQKIMVVSMEAQTVTSK